MSRTRSPSPFDKLKDFVFGKAANAPQTTPAAEPSSPPECTPSKQPVAPPPQPSLGNARLREAPAVRPNVKEGKKASKKPAQKAVHRYGHVTTGRLTPKLVEKPKTPPAPGPSRPEFLSGPKALSYVLERVDLKSLNVSAPAQSSVSAKTSAAVDRVVARGAKLLGERPDPDPMGYRIGLDFGTSTTKVVLCSDAADVDYALETPADLRVEEDGRRQQHLWRTCVWFNDTTQCFQLTPSDGSRPILGFKTGLIQGDGNRMLEAGITHNAAATAFLALLIAYIVGADAERIEASGGAERHYSRFHIGVPVPSLEEDPRVAGFHRVAQAAFALAPRATALRLDDVRAALQRELRSTETRADTPYQLFEELAGVVAGYMLTPERAGGPHIIVDVGAATLDVATFHLPDGEYPLEVYETGVALLGAQALECARAAGVPEQTFRAACQAHTSSVLSKTFRTKNYTFLPGEGGPSKPMIYVGGGRLTSLHQVVFKGYADAYVAPRRSPEVDRWLERDLNTDAGRLLLAWGLAQDPAVEGIPRIRPPFQVEPTLQGKRDWESGYVASEFC